MPITNQNQKNNPREFTMDEIQSIIYKDDYKNPYISTSNLQINEKSISNIPNSLDNTKNFTYGYSGPIMDILSSTGKKEEDKPQFIYNVVLQLDGENQNYWDDVVLFNVHKYGTSFSTLYLIRVNLTIPVYQQIVNDINDGKYPKCTVYLYSIDTLKNNKLKNLIFKKKLNIRCALTKTSPNLKDGTQVMVDLFLMNPVLHEMFRKYTFNKVYSSKSAYSILKEYESYIDKQYGDVFISKHFLCNESSYIYKQLVTKPSQQDVEIPSGAKLKFKTKNDISIPMFLQYKYKFDNGFGIYFFDDFVVTENKDITRYFISFFDYNKLEKFDISKYQDITKQTQYIKSYAFNDYDKNITKDNVVITHKLPNSNYTTTKTETGSTQQNKAQSNDKVILADDKRFFYGKTSNNTTSPVNKSTEEINIQSPDSKSSAEKRLKIGVDTYLKKIDSIEEYVIFNTSPDWLKFGCVYNLNTSQPDNYIFSPIGIINVFHRINSKEKELSLMDKALFIKFKPQKVESESKDVNPVPKSSNSSVPNINKEKQSQSDITRSVINSKSTNNSSPEIKNVKTKKTNAPKELIDEEKNKKLREELAWRFNDGDEFDIKFN